MKDREIRHWALQRIAEREVPSDTVNLWPRVEALVAARGVGGSSNARIRMRRGSLVVGPAIALLAIVLLARVPAVRALADDVVQRMGIAFLNTERHDETTVVEAAEMIRTTPPPSLGVAEIRRRISFPLRAPTWLPDDLIHVHGSIAEYDPAQWEGSGQKAVIEYWRTAGDFEKDVLFLSANDGPISAPPLLAESRQQPVVVNGEPGIYVHGGWRDDGRGDPNTRIGILQWDDQADDAYLTWTQDGITYLLAAHNLGLDLEDVMRIAASMTVE